MKIRKLLSILLLALCLTACGSQKQRDYYADEGNYIQASGTVTHIRYTDDREALYLGIEGLDGRFADVNFRIVGGSLPRAQENGIGEKLHIGDEVTFTCAPQYWGDGYVVPIVEITAAGETLLEFDRGFQDLQAWLE